MSLEQRLNLALSDCAPADDQARVSMKVEEDWVILHNQDSNIAREKRRVKGEKRPLAIQESQRLRSI